MLRLSNWQFNYWQCSVQGKIWLRWSCYQNLINILMYHLQIEGVKETSLEHRDFFSSSWLPYRALAFYDVTSLGTLWPWSVSAVWEPDTCVEREGHRTWQSGSSQNVTTSSSRSPLKCIYWGQWRMLLMNVNTAVPEINCFLRNIMLLYSGTLQGFCGIGLCLKIQRILQWQAWLF